MLLSSYDVAADVTAIGSSRMRLVDNTRRSIQREIEAVLPFPLILRSAPGEGGRAITDAYSSIGQHETAEA